MKPSETAFCMKSAAELLTRSSNFNLQHCPILDLKLDSFTESARLKLLNLDLAYRYYVRFLLLSQLPINIRKPRSIDQIP